MSDKKITNEANEAASSVEIKVLLSDLWRGVIKFGWIAVVLALVFGGVQFYRSYVRFVPEYTVTATYTVQTENKVLSGGQGGVSAYSFYYDRDTHEKKYHITDHQQSSFDRGNYDSVDLLRYRKERIE